MDYTTPPYTMQIAETIHPSTLLYRFIFTDYYTGRWPDEIIRRSSLFDTTDPNEIEEYAKQFAQLSLEGDWSKLTSKEAFLRHLPQIAVVAAKSSWNRSSTDDLFGYTDLPWTRPTRTQLCVRKAYGWLLVGLVRISDRGPW